jgi:hypothetical protein
MMEAAAGLLAALLALAVVGAWWRRRVAPIVIAADPDVALLSSAAALRRLGAKITRYDTEAGTLEARVTPAGVVRVHAASEQEGITRVRLSGDPAARAVMRRFRSALSA